MVDAARPKARSALADGQALPDQQSILAQWPSDAPLLLSMVCIAYNHEPYIEQTLNGFLMQNTPFAWEIICYDDCSSDATRELISRYVARYPKLISAVFPEQNQQSQGIKPFAEQIIPRCRGRYIARCEGDDYWTDPDKVRKQVEYLQAHPDTVLVTHDIQSINSSGELLDAGHLAEFYKRDFNSRDLRQGWAGPVTQAMLFRNVIQQFPPEIRRADMGDVFLASLLGQFGGAHFMADIKPSMYRLHEGGMFSGLAASDKTDMQEQTFFWLYKYYKRSGQHEDARAYRLKALEKSLRHVGLTDLLRLVLARVAGLNIRKLISRSTGGA